MYKKGIYKILTNEPLTDAVWRMTLAGDTQWISAPGQFVNIALEGKYLRRPISICDYSTWFWSAAFPSHWRQIGRAHV